MLNSLPHSDLLVALFVSSLMLAFATRRYYGQYHFLLLVMLYGQYGWMSGLFIQVMTTVFSLIIGAVTAVKRIR